MTSVYSAFLVFLRKCLVNVLIYDVLGESLASTDRHKLTY